MKRAGQVLAGCLVAALVAAGGMVGAQILPEATDPAGDASPAYLDIVRAWVEATDDAITFHMRLAEAPPVESEVYIAYVWLVDGDRNPSTGQNYGAIGSDRNIRVSYDPINPPPYYGWNGYIDYIPWDPSYPPVPPLTVAFDRESNEVSITIPVGESLFPVDIDEDGLFNWRALAFNEAPTSTADEAPEGGYRPVSLYAAPPVHVDALIDIKPGSYPNAVNLGSHGRIPVAILSSIAFDATTLDPSLTYLAGAGVSIRGKGDNYMVSEEDVDGDGLVDLVVHVYTENLDPGSFQDGYACLVGFTDDWSVEVVGWDEITVVPPE